MVFVIYSLIVWVVDIAAQKYVAAVTITAAVPTAQSMPAHEIGWASKPSRASSVCMNRTQAACGTTMQCAGLRAWIVRAVNVPSRVL